MTITQTRRPSLAFVAGLLATLLVGSCGNDGQTEDAGAPPNAAAGTTDTGSPPPAPTTDTASAEPTGGAGGGVINGPCDLTEPPVVAAAFDAKPGAEEPGIARNCTYMLADGLADHIEVYYYGTAAEWDGIRQGYQDNRGPLTDVAGVGDEAFTPADVGDYELVVRAGDIVFAISYMAGVTPTDLAARMRSLAQDIIAGVA